MNPDNEKFSIEKIFTQIATAHHDKDAKALLSFYNPDVLFFDLAPPLIHRGVDVSSVDEWFDTWEGPIQLDHKDVNIDISADLAIATALVRMRGQKKEGKAIDSWFRATSVLKKRDSQWRIVHEHMSVPFYMDGSERAALDLKP